MEISGKEYPHPIFFAGKNRLSLNKLLEKLLPDNEGQIVVLCDVNTGKYCYPILKEALPVKQHYSIVISEGEKAKQLKTCETIWDFLISKNIKKDALLINLGGGVVSDIGGLAASLYMRGLRFINIPTTLMAMTDAAIGGKTGINFNNFKNNIGNITFPDAVIIDVNFLKTLTKREFNSGLIEMVKHGLIADINFFTGITENKFSDDLIEAIAISAKIKMDIISEDPFDSGHRRILNFGHTIGHAIESAYSLHSEKAVLHGEAVLLGMIAETNLSLLNGLLQQEDHDWIISRLKPYIQNINFTDQNLDNIFSILLHDKKHSSLQLNFSLLKKTGEALSGQNADADKIKQSLRFLQQILSNI